MKTTDKHAGFTKSFVHVARAWYAKPNLEGRDFVDEITFGLYDDQGGTQGEIAVRWYTLAGERPAPRLEAFDDSWRVLAALPDVLAALAVQNDRSISPEGFCRLLLGCGFEDRTPEEGPT